jgi:endonuclease/exonuclease/phosphatase (EEP) superfamily protein YafD
LVVALEKISKSQSVAKPVDELSKKRRIHRDWSGASIGLGLGVFGLILGRLGVLWIRFDVFSQFSVQFALLALACALGVFAPRYKSLCSAIVFVVFVTLYGLWPLLTTDDPERALLTGEKRLRVMQFNVHSDHADNAAVADVIRQFDPDIATLVEFVPNNQAALDALKAQWPYQVTCWDKAECDLAIISKHPFAGTSARGLWVGAAYVMATLGPEYNGLQVFATHTARFPFARAQMVQVNELARFLEGLHGPMLVMGDFNATPFSRVTQSFAERLGLTRQTSLPTWPADRGLPQLAIDHIFTSAGIRALSSERAGPAAGSDHLPIAITLAVPAP